MHGGMHAPETSEIEVLQKTAKTNLRLEKWHNLETFAVPPREQHRHNVLVPAFWQS